MSAPRFHSIGRLAILACVLGAIGCDGEPGMVRARAQIYIHSAALSSVDLESANGTYGASCVDRSGAWSVRIAGEEPLSHGALSVVLGDSACELTLTSFVVDGEEHLADPSMVLTDAWQAQGSAFALDATPVAFYGNAHLDALTFTDDFVLSLLYSADPSRLSASNTANYGVSSGSTTAGAVSAPSYTINLNALYLESDVDELVQAVSGTADLIDGAVTGQAYAVVLALPTEWTYADVDTAFTGASPITISGADPQIDAADFDLLAVDLTAPAVRHVIIANTVETVTSYQVITITFAAPWSPAPSGPAPVDLGAAGTFVLLAEAGVSSVAPSALTGDVGVSPIASGAITGFSLLLDGSGQFATSTQVDGQVFAADYSAPTPANLTAAVNAMHAAYTDAAGRVTPDATELGAGAIGGMTLVPGLYKWTGDVSIDSHLTISGGPADQWIMQISGTLDMASDVHVHLSGGAKAESIIWQVAGATTFGTGSHFEGILLGATSVSMLTGSTMNGRVYAQTAVTLQVTTITEPP